jgi:hypothetical protein
VTPFALLRHLAAAQGGIVTAAQARGAGLSRDEIRHLCRSGRWLRLARGCYLPVPAPATGESGVAAGNTACPDLADDRLHIARHWAGPEAVLADRRRQNRLVNAGWTVLRFTWQDTLDPYYIPHTIRQAIARHRI